MFTEFRGREGNDNDADRILQFRGIEASRHEESAKRERKRKNARERTVVLQERVGAGQMRRRDGWVQGDGAKGRKEFSQRIPKMTYE